MVIKMAGFEVAKMIRRTSFVYGDAVYAPSEPILDAPLPVVLMVSCMCSLSVSS